MCILLLRLHKSLKLPFSYQNIGDVYLWSKWFLHSKEKCIRKCQKIWHHEILDPKQTPITCDRQKRHCKHYLLNRGNYYTFLFLVKRRLSLSSIPPKIPLKYQTFAPQRFERWLPKVSCFMFHRHDVLLDCGELEIMSVKMVSKLSKHL